MTRKRDYFIEAPDDGLLTNPIGPWAQDKYRYVGMYAELFATGMKNKWPRRVYLDLFAGPGYSKLRDSGRVVLGSPLIALNLPDLFDAYVFSDDNPAALEALRIRVARVRAETAVTYVPGDANAAVKRIVEVMSSPDMKGALSFCFLDPYKLNIHFDTVRRIAEGRPVDFLILLALYVDANRNLQWYLADGNPTIDRFLGDQTWRSRWKEAQRDGASIVEFLAKEYSDHMSQIGYLPMTLEDMVKVRTYEKNLPLYFLAFFSRHRQGLKFWGEVRKYATDQLSLF